MADFPKQFAFPDPVVHISPYGLNSIGDSIGEMSFATALYPTANLAIFIPFRISRPVVLNKMFCVNGATVSGNVDLGIYSFDGTKIVSTGSTAQAGTSSLQSISISSTELGAGLFYLAVALDNGTGRFAAITPAAAFLKLTGCAEMSTAFALPATATFATFSNAYIPLIGATGRSVI